MLAAGTLPARRTIAQTGKPFRVSYVTIAASADSPQYRAFAGRLSELGWNDKRLVIDMTFLAGNANGYDAAMKEAVAHGADVLVAFGPEVALKAALAASSTVPIVMAAFDFDPFARGYVKSLARPEGMITGIYVQQIELANKRAELAAELFPGLKAAAMLWDEASADQRQATAAVSGRLGFDLFAVELGTRPYDYQAAVTKIPADHRRMLFVPNSPVFYFDREALGRLTLERRLPAIFAWRDWVLAGGLMSYGPRFTDMTRQLADYVDRLARGARPANLPIQQPAHIELVVNQATARTLGVEFPPALLARADEVIE